MVQTQHCASGGMTEKRLLVSLYFYNDVSSVSPVLNWENGH